MQPFVRRLPVALAGVALLLVAGCGDEGTAPDNPVPGIDQVEPVDFTAGSGDQTITIRGSDFVRSSVVRVNSADRPTEFVGRTELRASLPASDFATAGIRSLFVVNPPPGGGTSNVVNLTIVQPATPPPTITAVSPQSLTVGATSAELTIRGTGFVPQSRVSVNWNERPATFVSATELRVTLPESDLASGGSLTLRVLSPGGGYSNPATVEVRNPAPAITGLGATQTTAGQERFTLQVTGSGFVNGSEVRFNGAPRQTTRLGAGVLEATLVEGDLRAAGTFTITVTNPAPGGGTSNAMSFTIVHGVPEILLLPSQGAAAGRPGFTLYIHGEGFVEGSVVRWNGADRPTQYVGATRLTASISSADVAGPAVAQITVWNPEPGGGLSAASSFTVRQLGDPVATSTIELQLQARDLLYDPGTNRLYASVVGSSTPYGNTVVAIDPSTGSITGSVFVGSEPGRMARSDNGQYLYVGLNGASAVRRVTLATLGAGLQWSLLGGEVAGDIAVLPGMPVAVAVSRHRPGYSPPLEGVTIYDDGVARPTSSPGHTGGARIEFLDSPSLMYGYNNAHTGFEFFHIGIDASGARHLSARGGLIGGFYTDIVGAAGRIYGTDGSIVDADRQTKVGKLSGSGPMAIKPELGRAFVIGSSTIGVYDLNTFQLLGSVPIPSPGFDHPALVSPRLVPWGSDGMAFLDQTRVIIIRSPLFGS